MPVSIILPLPPPLNSMYRFGNGHMYKTKAVRDWEEECGYKLLYYPKMADNEHSRVKIHLYLKRDRDIDGSIKVVLDLLQNLRIIKNDSLVTHLEVIKEEDKRLPRMEILIQKIQI